MPAHQLAAAPGRPAKAEAGVQKKTFRCFVALWPDPEARDQLDALAQQLKNEHPGSRSVHPDNLHLTLAFLGPLEEEPARRVAQMLLAIDAAAFDWTLDRCGGFDRARVLWAGSQAEPRLAALAHAVRQGLDGLMVAYDHKAFSPHVTLLRNVVHAPAPRPCEPILWQVTRPQLMVSERDAGGAVHYCPWAEPAIP